jgi:hypothetical protein
VPAAPRGWPPAYAHIPSPAPAGAHHPRRMAKGPRDHSGPAGLPKRKQTGQTSKYSSNFRQCWPYLRACLLSLEFTARRFALLAAADRRLPEQGRNRWCWVRCRRGQGRPGRFRRRELRETWEAARGGQDGSGVQETYVSVAGLICAAAAEPWRHCALIVPAIRITGSGPLIKPAHCLYAPGSVGPLRASRCEPVAGRSVEAIQAAQIESGCIGACHTRRAAPTDGGMAVRGGVIAGHWQEHPVQP